MSNDERLIIGLPAGSLVDPSRGGNLVQLLKHAGFPTKGYEEGGPTSFPINAMLFGWDGRPQEFGAQLALGEIDIAIAGDDWIREREIEYDLEYGQRVKLQKVLPLERGRVRIVIVRAALPRAVSCAQWLTGLLKKKNPVTMVSEMPYLALEWFRSKIAKLGFAESHGGFSVQKYRTPPKIESGLVVYETWGKTEAKIRNGSVDFGLEITQTGGALRSYGLEIVEEVLASETSVWANPAIKTNPAKYELARMFLLNLYGSIFAENRVLLNFNARKTVVPQISAYIAEHGLAADEPTINEGINFVEISVEVEIGHPKLPLARIRYELAKLGATHIETIPVHSSIPGIDALDF